MEHGTRCGVSQSRAATDTLAVMFYGVHKDGKTLAQILDKATFAGVLVSDDAAIYQGFSKAPTDETAPESDPPPG